MNKHTTTYPLLESQLGIFLEWAANPSLTQYNLPFISKLPKYIDSDRLINAINSLPSVRPEMKLRFVMEDGVPRQYIDETIDIKLNVSQKSESEVQEYISTLVKPCDLLSGEPLWRFELIETESFWYLFFEVHHSVGDGTTIFPTLVNDISKLYYGIEIQSSELNIMQYAQMEVESLGTEAYQRAKQYYADKFSGVELLTLSSHKDGSSVGNVIIESAYMTMQEVDSWCKDNDIKANLLFMAAFSYTMSTLSREDKIAYSTIGHGRMDKRLKEAYGMFVKITPILSNIDRKQRVIDYIRDFRSELISTKDYGIYPFNHFCLDLNQKMGVLFGFQGYSMQMVIKFGEDNFKFNQLPKGSVNSDLSIIVYYINGEYDIRAEASDKLYSATYLRQVVQMVKVVAENMMHSPFGELGTIATISENEQQEILALSKGEDLEYDRAETIIDVILRNAEAYADSVAVVDKVSQITYKEFANYSNNVAAKLLEIGVERDDFVGVMLPRRKEFSVAQLAVMRSGAAYVPMDVEYPNERIQYMLKDSMAKVLITTKELYTQKQSEGDFEVERVIFIEDINYSETTVPINRATPDGLAYMIYTSGSTGLPKGTMLPHRALKALSEWRISVFAITTKSRYAVHPSFSFDSSVNDLLPPLVASSSIYIIDEQTRKDLDALYNYLKENQITGLTMSTALGMAMLNQYSELPIKYLMLGGEKLLPFPKTDVRVINEYGPTEFSVCSSFHVVDQDRDIPIGRPVPNSSSFICDMSGNLLPQGVAGELCLMGVQIANGYWQREELTAEKFVDCKFIEDQKMYRTGDLARWNESGELEFLGRIDNQIKLRGFRIELGEIETQVKSYTDILSSVVEVKEIGGVQHLCAYYTSNIEIDKNSLKEHLSKSLTDYMVPTTYIQLEELPLTPNGKVDRKRLPAPQLERTTEFIAPRNRVESDICNLFMEQLSIEQVGINDDYFLIGGSSLSAIRLVLEVNKLGYDVKYADIFRLKTAEKIAEFIGGDNPLSTQNEEFFDLSNYDYTAIDNLLKKNGNIESIYTSEPYTYKSILLTGATGYLGAYLLNRVVLDGVQKIYCLVRPSEKISALERLKSIYAYYFDDLSIFDNGIVEIIEGDITDENIVDVLSNYTFDILINPAAMVKHYVADDSMHKVNVKGVENLIDVCERSRARLIHISTYSVSAMTTTAFDRGLTECMLYFGQTTNNEYIRTKFLAERAVLQAVADGRIDAKIMRVGNLMGRENDGEFQINFRSNAFLNSIKSYKVLEGYPIEAMVSPIEVSPINRVAEAIVKLTSTPKEMIVFHPYNPYEVDMGVVVKAMNSHGFSVELMSDGAFRERIATLSQDANKNIYLQGLLHYSAGNTNLVNADVDNNFTTTVLYYWGFYWSVMSNDYFAHLLETLDTLGFFDE